MAEGPFRTDEPSEEALDGAYYSDHNLREMYARENTERRRTGGHTYRKYLSGPQDRKMTGLFPKIRDEYEVHNNNDVVIAFAKLLIDEGKADEVDERLRAIAASTEIPKRQIPFTETITHDRPTEENQAA